MMRNLINTRPRTPIDNRFCFFAIGSSVRASQGALVARRAETRKKRTNFLRWPHAWSQRFVHSSNSQICSPLTGFFLASSGPWRRKAWSRSVNPSPHLHRSHPLVWKFVASSFQRIGRRRSWAKRVYCQSDHVRHPILTKARSYPKFTPQVTSLGPRTNRQRSAL